MIGRQYGSRAGQLLALLMLSLVAQRSRAAGASEIEVLIRQGVELRHDGRDVQAVPIFQKAYELERSPRTAGQLGLCELALGYWVDAEAHLGEALASESHPWVKKNLPSLRASLETARRNLGEVEVSAIPATGRVLVDQHEVGPLPLARPLRLTKGPHDIVIRVPGGSAIKKAVVIAGGDKQVVGFDLEPVAVEPPAQAAGALETPAPQSVSAAQAPASSDGLDKDTSLRDHRRPVAWVTAGAAVAALGLGVFESVRWNDKRREFDAHTGPLMSTPGQIGPNCGLAEPNYGGAGCRDIDDALSRARVLSVVSYGAFVVLGGAAAYLFATSGESSSSQSQTALACAPTLERGVACRLTF